MHTLHKISVLVYMLKYIYLLYQSDCETVMSSPMLLYGLLILQWTFNGLGSVYICNPVLMKRSWYHHKAHPRIKSFVSAALSCEWDTGLCITCVAIRFSLYYPNIQCMILWLCFCVFWCTAQPEPRWKCHKFVQDNANCWDAKWARNLAMLTGELFVRDMMTSILRLISIALENRSDKSPRERSCCHETGQPCIQEEQHECFVVQQPYCVDDPHTVVIHFEHTSP